MAGTDPKKTRDPGRLSDREDFDADEDPLVELARIVSEDGGFSGRMTPKARVEPARPTTDRNAFSSDLEAELLHELETSFSGRETPPAESEPYAASEEPYAEPEPEPVRQAQDEPEEPVYPAPLASREPRSRGPSQPAPQADDPDDLLRSIEQQLSQFEQRVRTNDLASDDRAPVDEEARWSSGGAEESDVAPEPRDEWEDAPGMAAARSEYRFRGPAAAGWDRTDEPTYEPAAADDEPTPQEPEPVEEPVSEPFGRPREAPAEDYAEEETAEADMQAAPDYDEAPMPVEEPAVTEVRHGVRDFASLEEELSAELDSAYRAQESGARRAVQEEPEGEREFATAAAIAPGAGMRPPQQPQPQAAAPRRQRSGRGLMMAAAGVIVVVIGGVGALYYRSLDRAPSGPPPVIAAPEGPVKIEPAEQAGAGEETVGEAVFNRVAGNTPETQETVVDGAEEPREIAQIVTPEPQGGGEEAMTEETAAGEAAMGDAAGMADAAEDSAPPAAEAASSEEGFGPRRVPTFVVRPDGTIVSTAEAEGAAGEPSSAEQDMGIAQTEAMEPTPVETVPIEEPRTAGAPAASQPTMAAENTASGGTGAAPAETGQAMAPAQESTTGDTMDAQTETAAVEPAGESAGAAAGSLNEETEVAAVEPAEVPPTATSGYLVQLSAQTSQADAEATFAGLQRRYPAVLGDLEANIQRADLDKGTFFRVRVGPWAERSQAVEVCESLKAAGADCYVTR